ncbi:MAG: peptidoglycan-binding domain-containing protein [Clostridia bacterium]|nr:peptidoglycan-binding domain-containing protein [Clostridia bacterium]
MKPACPTGGYPLVKQGRKGVYVAVLQDALNTLGYNAGAIDGVFGANTKNAVVRYQRDNRLAQDGIVGCNTWKSITQKIASSRYEELF